MVKEGDYVKAWINDKYSPIHGEKGYVDHIDDVGTIHIKFDSGKTLGAIPCDDKVEVLKKFTKAKG